MTASPQRRWLNKNAAWLQSLHAERARVTAKHLNAWTCYVQSGQPATGPAADSWNQHLTAVGRACLELAGAAGLLRTQLEHCDNEDPGEHCVCGGCLVHFHDDGFSGSRASMLEQKRALASGYFKRGQEWHVAWMAGERG